ncbi:MAG TPA: glucose 1-dehydrogenase [Cycloclasticus sp.]|jgi:NAD(P)-dependent dehydrogenase (short-subunit alcohol dehydrogenase family)|nr:glucose 1-dehydrogenase [Cycloclasticus sp.]HIL92839.1 glucose 1-dehydrogenase [Cycloclasticus sp.]
MANFKDKTVIITGGARGIGLATGQLFAKKGANVLLVDLDESVLKEAVNSISSDSDVSYYVADVTKVEQVQGYVKATIERYGAVDYFINNAGIEGVVAPIVDSPIDMFDQVINVNIKGVWLGLKYVIPAMLENGGGSIVITSSVAGIKGTPNISPYVTSKHAVIGMMRSVSQEYATQGIRINTVNPAPIETRMMRSLETGFAPGQEAAAKEQLNKMMPMARYGEPEEVASLMAFLCSDDASYCTGGVYSVDGGASAL